MADVVNSSAHTERTLSAKLRFLVDSAQDVFADQILSPITITLGDEFQTIMVSHRAMVEMILYLEDQRLLEQYAFRLRYSIATGPIEVDINRKNAHGMIGPALTDARRKLVEKSRDRREVSVTLPDSALAEVFENIFSIMIRELVGWPTKDRRYLYALISELSNRGIALLYGRDESVVSRRRRSNPVRTIKNARKALLNLAEIADRLEAL